MNDIVAPREEPRLDQLVEESDQFRTAALRERLVRRTRLTAEDVAKLERDFCRFEHYPLPPQPGEYIFCLGLNEPNQYWESDYAVIEYARYIGARCIDWAEAVFDSPYGAEEPVRLEKRTQYGGLIWKSLPLPVKLRIEAHFIRARAEACDITPPSSLEDAARWLDDVARELEETMPGRQQLKTVP
ncbi:MAG: hypothetical protein ABSB70_09260 [Candidatus Velthaea sp.]